MPIGFKRNRRLRKFSDKVTSDMIKEEATLLTSFVKRRKWKKLENLLNDIEKGGDEAKGIFSLVREQNGMNVLQFLFEGDTPIDSVLKIIHTFPYLVREVDPDGVTSLHAAAACGLPPIFTRTVLSIYPESAIMKDKFERTPLIAACQSQSSGMNMKAPYSFPGIDYNVDFWIHQQIISALLNIPINGVSCMDCCGFNALDYALHGNGPSSVVQMLQAHLAIERQILLELNDTTKRTKLPKLPQEPDPEKTNSTPWSLPSVMKSFGDGIRDNEDGSYESGWRPIVLTSRGAQDHNRKRRDIYERMRNMKFSCDSSVDTRFQYKKGLKNFLGARDCDDSTSDDIMTVIYNPFDLDIPLIVDVITDQDNADHQICDDI